MQTNSSTQEVTCRELVMQSLTFVQGQEKPQESSGVCTMSGDTAALAYEHQVTSLYLSCPTYCHIMLERPGQLWPRLGTCWICSTGEVCEIFFRGKREYCHNCSLVVALCSFLQLHSHLSSSQVRSARFGFISLGSLTVLRLLCVCVILFSCIISACMLQYCNTVR